MPKRSSNMTVTENRENRFRRILKLGRLQFSLLQRFNREENIDPAKLSHLLYSLGFLMQELTQDIIRDLANPPVAPKTRRHRVRFTKYDRGILGSFGITV